MKQCKLCGMPFRDEVDSLELREHWKKHHSWHGKNKNYTPEDALLKKR